MRFTASAFLGLAFVYKAPDPFIRQLVAIATCSAADQTMAPASSAMASRP